MLLLLVLSELNPNADERALSDVASDDTLSPVRLLEGLGESSLTSASASREPEASEIAPRPGGQGSSSRPRRGHRMRALLGALRVAMQSARPAERVTVDELPQTFPAEQRAELEEMLANNPSAQAHILFRLINPTTGRTSVRNLVVVSRSQVSPEFGMDFWRLPLPQLNGEESLSQGRTRAQSSTTSTYELPQHSRMGRAGDFTSLMLRVNPNQRTHLMSRSGDGVSMRSHGRSRLGNTTGRSRVPLPASMPSHSSQRPVASLPNLGLTVVLPEVPSDASTGHVQQQSAAASTDHRSLGRDGSEQKVKGKGRDLGRGSHHHAWGKGHRHGNSYASGAGKGHGKFRHLGKKGAPNDMDSAASSQRDSTHRWAADEEVRPLVAHREHEHAWLSSASRAAPSCVLCGQRASPKCSHQCCSRHCHEYRQQAADAGVTLPCCRRHSDESSQASYMHSHHSAVPSSEHFARPARRAPHEQERTTGRGPRCNRYEERVNRYEEQYNRYEERCNRYEENPVPVAWSPAAAAGSTRQGRKPGFRHGECPAANASAGWHWVASRGWQRGE